MSLSSRLALTVLACLSFSITLVTAQSAAGCYNYGNGGISIGGAYRCNNETGVAHSQCCAMGDICMTNGLCKSGGDATINWFWREQCTDASWNDPACPQYCFAKNNNTEINANWLVFECDAQAGVYCCSYTDTATPGTNYECCNDPSRTFTAGPASALTTIGATPSATFNPSAVSTSTSLAATLTSPAAASTSTAPGQVVEVPGVTVVGQEAHASDTAATQVGLGVGLGLGLPLLFATGLIAYWFWRKRRNEREAAVAAAFGTEKGSMSGPPSTANSQLPPQYAEAQAVRSELQTRTDTKVLPAEVMGSDGVKQLRTNRHTQLVEAPTEVRYAELS